MVFVYVAGGPQGRMDFVKLGILFKFEHFLFFVKR